MVTLASLDTLTSLREGKPRQRPKLLLVSPLLCDSHCERKLHRYDAEQAARVTLLGLGQPDDEQSQSAM